MDLRRTRGGPKKYLILMCINTPSGLFFQFQLSISGLEVAPKKFGCRKVTCRWVLNFPCLDAKRHTGKVPDSLMLLSPLHEQQNTPHLLQFLLSHINSIFFMKKYMTSLTIFTRPIEHNTIMYFHSIYFNLIIIIFLIMVMIIML